MAASMITAAISESFLNSFSRLFISLKGWTVTLLTLDLGTPYENKSLDLSIAIKKNYVNLVTNAVL